MHSQKVYLKVYNMVVQKWTKKMIYYTKLNKIIRIMKRISLETNFYMSKGLQDWKKLKLGKTTCYNERHIRRFDNIPETGNNFEFHENTPNLY